MINEGRFLVADCGSSQTTVALVERVNGSHRLVARGEAFSTHHPPWLDATIGVQEAIRQIEALVGRRLLTDAGALIKPRISNGDGVDAFVVVSSAGTPMRVVLAGLTRDLSLASAQRAAAGTYMLVTGTLGLDDGIARRSSDARMQTLHQAKPDVILIAGGTDGGATLPVLDLAQLAALYSGTLTPEERPLIFYAGNAHLASQVAACFAGVGELRVVANLRPALDFENIGSAQAALDVLYRDRRLARVPGFDRLREWAGKPVLPTARSFGQVIRYIGDRYQVKVVGLDLGSASTLLAARAGGLFSLTTCADVGIGSNVGHALDQIPIERIMRWLPFKMDSGDVRDALLNKSLHPASVAQTWQDLMLEYAMAREIMRQVVSQARPGWLRGGHHLLADTPQWDLIIGAGNTLTQTPHPAHTALLLLDALEPIGVSKIAIDSGRIATTLGAMANAYPLAATEVVGNDAFLTLGTIVAPLGTARTGDVALRIKVSYQDGRVVQEEVAYGSLTLIPLEPGEHATLELRPTRRFDVGLGEPGRGAVAEAEGGILGIVVDARGRPLNMPADYEACRRLNREWLSNMGLSLGEKDLESELIGWLYESANQGGLLVR